MINKIGYLYLVLIGILVVSGLLLAVLPNTILYDTCYSVVEPLGGTLPSPAGLSGSIDCSDDSAVGDDVSVLGQGLLLAARGAILLAFLALPLLIVRITRLIKARSKP